jgi:hypothetical protein
LAEGGQRPAIRSPRPVRRRLSGQLLARERGVRNLSGLPALTEVLILSWADRHKRRTGRWPTENSGPIADAPGEVWANINAALAQLPEAERAAWQPLGAEVETLRQKAAAAKSP